MPLNLPKFAHHSLLKKHNLHGSFKLSKSKIRLNEVAEKLQSTKQVVEEELERVNAEKVSLQTQIVKQRDENEKLKEAMELSKDQHFGTTQSRKRKS